MIQTILCSSYYSSFSFFFFVRYFYMLVCICYVMLVYMTMFMMTMEYMEINKSCFFSLVNFQTKSKEDVLKKLILFRKYYKWDLNWHDTCFKKSEKRNYAVYGSFLIRKKFTMFLVNDWLQIFINLMIFVGSSFGKIALTMLFNF